MIETPPEGETNVTSTRPRREISRRAATVGATMAVLLVIAILGDFWRRGQTARQHFPVASIPELPYPACAASVAAIEAPLAGESPAGIIERVMHSGPNETRGSIFERYRIERRGCMYAVTSRQAWPMQVSDLEAIYDETFTPIRLWRRFVNPRSHRAGGDIDIKRFDFGTPDVSVKHQSVNGAIDFELLRGKKKARPTVLIGPGRGLITMWLKRAKLAVGAKSRETALDVRAIEIIKDVTLRRDEDRFDPGLNRLVRVYSFYGRETVFADENDTVIGDLGGLVPDDTGAEPPLPDLPPIDPVHTP